MFCFSDPSLPSYLPQGYCLPATLEDLSFEWLYWPQAKLPFDAQTLEYIAALDCAKDAAILEAHNIRLRSECLRVLRVSTMLLQMGAARGLSPYQIACIATRQSFTKSPLEKLHQLAMQGAAADVGAGRPAVGPPGAALAGASGAALDAAYLHHMQRLLEDFLSEFALEHGDYDEDILF